MLQENVAANYLPERVICYQEAVGNSHFPHDLSVLTTAYSDHANIATGEFTASTVSLEEVIERCAHDGPFGLVKIDAEGAEADILEGARPQMLNAIRQFVIEYHDTLCEHALARCERVLRDAGFHCITRPVAPQLGLLYAISGTANR